MIDAEELHSGERQVAESLDGIRADHVARYEWAARTLAPESRVIDLACGVGYGSRILAEAGHMVMAFDKSTAAIEHARKHFAHKNIIFVVADADGPSIQELDGAVFDAAVCFETIEHLADPRPMLARLRAAAPLLLASVPDEAHFPFKGYQFHHRHYTKAEFAALLAEVGFTPIEWLGQRGPHSKVGPQYGRTLIVRAERAALPVSAPAAVTQPAPAIVKGRVRAAPPAPERVAILGLGISLRTYVVAATRQGGRKKLCDEVWGINAGGDILACDRVFHMDDVRIQEIRAAADPNGNIAAMLPWLKAHPGPVYTSQPHPDYPGMVALPIAAILNSCAGQRYFNSTAAWAIAYAIHIGVKKIMCFGMDFTLPNAHHAEQGRACVEFWLGFARARGIDIAVPKESSLLDAAVPNEQRLYGYDCVDVHIKGPPGQERVRLKPRATLPTAAEIERRYDHSRHPNPLMRD